MISPIPYSSKLDSAILRSLDYLSAAELEFSKNISSLETYTFSDALQEEITVLFEKYWRSNVGIDTIALQCAQASLTMSQILQEKFHIDSLLTVGSVQLSGATVCGGESQKSTSARISGQYHVWLTLPGNVVFNISLLPSLQYLKSYSGQVFPICVPADSQPHVIWSPTGAGFELVKYLVRAS